MIADLSRRAYEYRAHVLQHGLWAQIRPHRRRLFHRGDSHLPLYFHQLRLDPANPALGQIATVSSFLRDTPAPCSTPCLAHRGYFPLSRSCCTFPQSEQPPYRGTLNPQKTSGRGSGCWTARTWSRDRCWHGARRTPFWLHSAALTSSSETASSTRGHLGRPSGCRPSSASSNLTVIVDYNGVQQTGLTASVMPTEPIADKWAAFNWHVIEIHGHNTGEVLNALDHAEEIHGRPTGHHCPHHQGQGRQLYGEPSSQWHGGIPNEVQFQHRNGRAEGRMRGNGTA